MISWKPLREIITFRGGGTPSKKIPEYWNGNIPWATVKDFTSTLLSTTQDFITPDGLKKSSANLIPMGHVIIPTRMSLGKAAINSIDLAINQDLRALIPKVEVNEQYLLFAMLSLKDEIVRKGSGATVKGITQKELYNLKIPLPSLDDQIRIADLLSKVEGLIAQRKQNLQQLDDLLKSVFLEMFGDPVRNEKGWEERSLSAIFSVKHGFAFKSKFFEDTGPFVLLTPGNFFEEGGFRDRGTRQKYYVGETSEEYILNKNDLLVAMTEQAPGLLGSPLIVPKSERYLHNQRLGLICAKESIQVYFLFHLFNQKSTRQIIHAKATGAKVRHTSPTKIENIVVGYPPADLQKRFVTIVDKVDSIKSQYQQSLTELENLYSVLSQKAFKGELDLSRVVVPAEQKEASENIKPVEAAAPEKDAKATIVLPAPADLDSLNSTEGRKVIINQWLDFYLDQLDGISFSAEHFMEIAQERVWELIEDNEPVLGAAAYDQFKEWLFLSLASGRLVQDYDNTGNRVKILPAKG